VRKKPEETPQSRLRKILHHHVALGVESLFSCFFSAKNPSNLPFHHVLNRIMVVAQVPIMFVVLRNVEGERPEFYISNKHKNEGHQTKIRERVGEIFNEATPTKEYLIPLWHEKKSATTPAWHASTTGKRKYYLLVLEAHSEKYEFRQLKRVHRADDVKCPEDAAIYTIEKVFSPKMYFHYGEAFFNSLAYSLDTIEFGEEPEKSKKIEETTDPFWGNFLGDRSASKDSAARTRLGDARKKSREITRKKGTPYALAGEGVLDRAFRNLKGSIASLSSDAAITNCLLFTRSYDRPLNCPRFGTEYDYNVRISRGQEQCNEHLDAFRRWSSSERVVKESNFLGAFADKSDESRRMRLILTDAVAEIWQKIAVDLEPSISEQDEDKRKGLQKILHDDFGDNARSVSEPVFEGISFFRDPFIRLGGIERCFPNGIPDGQTFADLNPQEKKDILRVVAFNFLLQDMAPESKQTGNPSRIFVMLNPIELGGKVWAVASYAARMTEVVVPFIDSLDRLEQWNGYWLKNFHTFHDVHERLKRSLRQHLKTACYELFAEVYARKIWDLRYKSDLQIIEKEINDELREFTCFFPYAEVSITLEHDKGRRYPIPYRPSGVHDPNKIAGKENRALFAEHLAARVDIKENSRYPNAPGRDQDRPFVSPSELAIAFTDAVFRRSVLDENRRRDQK
jgi:hypothetical protein